MFNPYWNANEYHKTCNPKTIKKSVNWVKKIKCCKVAHRANHTMVITEMISKFKMVTTSSLACYCYPFLPSFWVQKFYHFFQTVQIMNWITNSPKGQTLSSAFVDSPGQLANYLLGLSRANSKLALGHAWRL